LENKPKSEAEAAFDEMADIAVERGGAVADNEETDGEGEHQTLEQSLASPQLTDFQVADRRLSPDTGYKHLNMLQVARIFPEQYTAMRAILIKDLLTKDQSLSVAEASAIVDTCLSIGLDGEGRIDILSLMGNVNAAAEKNDLNKLGA
jgi:hypothetical protein